MTMSFLGGFRWGVVSIGGLISETPEHTATDTTTRTQINHDPQQTFLQEETITETESKEKSSNRAMKCGVMVTLAEDTLDAVVSITHNKLTTTSETTNDAKTISFLYNHHCNNAVALGVNVEQTTSDGSTDTDNYRSAKHDSTTRNIGVGVAVTPLESTIIGIDLVQKHASRNSQAFNSIGQTVLDGDSSFDNLSLSIGAEFWTLQHTLAIRMGGTKSIASRRSYQDESATMRTEVSSKEGSDGDDILTAGLGWKMSERWLLEYGITMQGTATQEALVTVTF